MHGPRRNDHMPCRDCPAWTAEQRDEAVARLECGGGRAGLVGLAGAVHLARCNTRNADVRAFRAPDRSIAVPDMGRRAGEALSCRDDGCCKCQEHFETLLKFAAEPEHPADDVDGAAFEPVPAWIGGIVAHHRNPPSLGFDGDPLDAERVIHAQNIDAVAEP